MFINFHSSNILNPTKSKRKIYLFGQNFPAFQNSLEKPIQVKICQIVCSIFKINNKKHMIMENFDNEKNKGPLFSGFLFITDVFYLKTMCIKKLKNNF